MVKLHSKTEPDPVEQLRAEIAEVRRQLFAALAGLASPLGDLVRGQLAASISELRIGLLLTAARGLEDSEQAQQQRRLLCAALEMLYLALGIHKLLLPHTQLNGNHSPERAWTGSVILAGDYCFSRSAMLAAQTNLPQVVTIFAQALKTVSEELLRGLFATPANALELPFDDERELVGAGLLAATVIAGLDQQAAATTINWGQKLIKQPRATAERRSEAAELFRTITALQLSHWQALLTLYDRNDPL